MYSLLNKVILQSDSIICLGDLNCDISYFLDNNNKGRSLLDICDIYDLDFLDNLFIRIFFQCFLCLDDILMNVLCYFRELGILKVGFSDYCLFYVVLNKKLL